MLSNAWFDNYIDSISGKLMEAQERNFDKWLILGNYVWPNPWPYATTYMGEVNNLKTWMRNRLAWLDANMPGTCDKSYGVDENEAESKFSIFPNPATDILNIEFSTAGKCETGMMIINQQGTILLSSKIIIRSRGEWFETLDVSSFTPGVYILRITLDGKMFTKRFIKI
jgi:hypothetical protein